MKPLCDSITDHITFSFDIYCMDTDLIIFIILVVFFYHKKGQNLQQLTVASAELHWETTGCH